MSYSLRIIELFIFSSIFIPLGRGGNFTMDSQKSSMAFTTLMNWLRSIGLVIKQFAWRLYALSTSSSALEIVSMTTGIRFRSSSFLIVRQHFPAVFFGSGSGRAG